MIILLLLLQSFQTHLLDLRPDGKTHTLKGALYPGTSKDRVQYRFKARQGERISLKIHSNSVSHRGSDSVGAVFFVVDSSGSAPLDFGDYPWGGPVEWTGALNEDSYSIHIVIEDSPEAPDHKALRKRKAVIRYTLKASLSPPPVKASLNR